MFTRTQIEDGLELAKYWYEGWKLEDLQPEQLLEAIEKSRLLPCERRQRMDSSNIGSSFSG